MKNLITPQEVVELALPQNTTVMDRNISETHISAAQQRYIVPALGRELVDALSESKYSVFADAYIRTPLALYSLYSAFDELTLKLGAGGVAIALPDNHSVATVEHLRALKRNFKRRADVLMNETIAHLTANNDSYPEFDPSESVFVRVISGGGIIIV